MKKILLNGIVLPALALLPGGGADAQSATSIADTVFLRKAVNGAAVFVVPSSGHAAAFRQLADFRLSAEEQQTLRQQGLAVPKKAGTKKADLGRRLSESWLPLYLYQGRFYLYLPCDAGTSPKLHIGKGYLATWFMDGPSATAIRRITRSSKGIYTLTFLAEASGNGAVAHRVYPIRNMPGAAVWEDPSAPPEARYQLYVSVEAAKRYPIIQNRCPLERAEEYDFEPVDFRRLMSGK